MKEKAKKYFDERRVTPINDYELVEFTTLILKEVFEEIESKRTSAVCNRTLVGIYPANEINKVIAKYIGEQDVED